MLLEHIIFTASSYIEVLGFVPAVWPLGTGGLAAENDFLGPESGGWFVKGVDRFWGPRLEGCRFHR